MEIDVNDKDFEEKVLEKSKKIPVIVDFWASWCGPCLMLGPILEKVAEDYDGKFILAKLDVQKNQQTAAKYNIMSIPAVKMFKHGKIVADFVGAKPESAVKEWIDSNL